MSTDARSDGFILRYSKITVVLSGSLAGRLAAANIKQTDAEKNITDFNITLVLVR